MAKKLTTDDFLKRAREIHGDKYDYSKSVYQSRHVPVTIICKEHGEFYQTPGNHYKGLGCFKCKHGRSQYPTQKEVIERFKKQHGDRYDYSLVEFSRIKDKVKIICRKHGVFLQSPDSHMRGRGCNICAFGKVVVRKSKPRLIKNDRDFIELSKEIHDQRYDYSLVEYKNQSTKVIIKCRIHGEFQQLPHLHLSGANCPDCARVRSARSRRITKDEFIKRSIAKHGDKYDYSRVNLKLVTENVEIVCPIHGLFEQEPHRHMTGAGCRECGFQFWGSYSYFEKNPLLAHERCLLYLIEFQSTHGDEVFIKVGHTRKGIKKRFPAHTIKDYETKVLAEISASFYECSMLENEVHRKFKEYSFSPKYLQEGRTECYNKTIKDEIGRYLINNMRPMSNLETPNNQ